jgi:flagellin-like protein
MKNENRNEEAVSPVIATILMVAITVVLAGVLYVWASSLAEGNTDGNLALYAFSGEDAQGQPSTGTDDNLIMLTMDQGGDINWASVSVKLSIDGGSPVFCDNPGGEGGVCVLVDNGRDTNDQFWSVGDTVTIVETGTDLCSSSCSIDVTITDTREEKVIDTTNGVPAE